MFSKLIKNEAGQGAAEFALCMVFIFLPLIYGMASLAELINLKHGTFETSRLAVWEQAYGRPADQIQEMVETRMPETALFSPAASVTVDFESSVESTEDDFLVLGFSRVADRLGLSNETRYNSRVSVSGRVLAGFDYTVSSNYSMIGDPWQLTDQNDNGEIDDEDLEEVVNQLYFYFPIAIGEFNIGAIFTDILNEILDFIDLIFNNPITEFFQSLTGLSFDIDPRGHPQLDEVPEPAEGN